MQLAPALAILNAVPCWFLDGHLLMGSLLEIVLPDRLASPERRGQLLGVMLGTNAMVLGLVIVLAGVRVALGF